MTDKSKCGKFIINKARIEQKTKVLKNSCNS